MSKDVKFYLDQKPTREAILLGNEALRKLEYEYMDKVLSQIRAEFLQAFGFEGDFVLEHDPTETRERYRISSKSARTTMALQKNPGWLGKFVEQGL